MALWVIWTLRHSKALSGLGWVKVLSINIAAVVSAGILLFFVGVSLNKSRPHAYTPEQYKAALLAGTPTPIVQQTQQIYNQNIYPTTKVLTKTQLPHAHIVFDPPEMLAQGGPYGPKKNLRYTNEGPTVVLNASFRAQVSYGQLSPGCDGGVFDRFKRGLEYSSAGPMLAVHESKWGTFTPGELQQNHNQGLYISETVRWHDESGEYDTDYFTVLSPVDHQFHACLIRNGEIKLKAKSND